MFRRQTSSRRKAVNAEAVAAMRALNAGNFGATRAMQATQATAGEWHARQRRHQQADKQVTTSRATQVDWASRHEPKSSQVSNGMRMPTRRSRLRTNPAGPASRNAQRNSGTGRSPGETRRTGSAAPATSPGTKQRRNRSSSLKANKRSVRRSRRKTKPRDTKGQEEKAGRRAAAAALTQASCRIRQSGFRLTTPAPGFDEQDARLTDQAGSLNYSNSAICTAFNAAPFSN